MSSVKVNLKGWLNVKKQIAGLAAKSVRVGVFSNERHPDSDYSDAELAALHEYGSPKGMIPERSFLRSTLERKDVQERVTKLMGKVSGQVAAGKTSVTEALGVLGEVLADEVKETLEQNKTSGPPLAPETVERKQSDTKLVDTGRLVDKVGWVIK